MSQTKQPEQFQEFGRWRVFSDGTLKGKYFSPSGRESELTIYPDRLNEPDLFLRMLAERATDFNDFLPAFFDACEKAGIHSINKVQTTFL